MGTITIKEYTTKQPITMIGELSGVCYNSPTDNPEKNFRRGMHNLESEHGRTWEFPDVYMIIDGYSARVMREWYTHIGGSPTRVQASTRYIDYAKNGFRYITPKSIEKKSEAKQMWHELMDTIRDYLEVLEEDYNIPHEDTANGLPLGMTTTVVCKMNFRTLVDMSHNRMCTCAYWEFRQLFNDIRKALSEYSEEWASLVADYFVPKCEITGFCNEGIRTCNRKPLVGAEAVAENTKEKTEEIPDNVNHPAHYTSEGIECIDAMIAAYGKEAVKNFCACNAFKYTWRFDKKNGAEDMEKAKWYLNKYHALDEKTN